MKYILTIIVLMTVCFETTILNFPLTLVLIILLSMTQGTRAALLAFGAGLIYDLFAMRSLGGSSLFFLAVCLIISTYQRKIYLSGSFVPLVFVAFFMTVYQFVFTRSIDIVQIIFSVLFSTICLFVINRYLPEIDSPGKRMQ